MCRAVDPESRESQAVFRCTQCGHTAHADVNAAKNILAAGRAGTACGDLAVRRSVKQEPQPALALVGTPPAVGRTSSMPLSSITINESRACARCTGSTEGSAHPSGCSHWRGTAGRRRCG
ncbi:zinc ribbon domain-containing protein [Saccharopolyspora hattusasensis]|uniref:zinc ribbon domain-containing protein n=1 Tax=Saccharopolyspora hattusasensis TaxID=1128679 RepID=UPI003D9A01A2